NLRYRSRTGFCLSAGLASASAGHNREAVAAGKEIGSRAVVIGLKRCWVLYGCTLVVLVATGPATAQPNRQAQISAMVRHNRLAEAEQQLWNVLREQPNQVWALKLM